MDKYLAKDEISYAWDFFQDFEDCVKTEDETYVQYINKFDSLYQRLKTRGMVLPEMILAFKLLKGAKLLKEERLIILTGMNFENKQTLYQDAMISLKKFKSGPASDSATSSSSSNMGSIKVEPVFVTENAGRSRGFSYRGGYNSRGRRGVNNYNYSNRGYYHNHNEPERQNNQGFNHRGRGTRKINPTGYDGRPLRCKACGSFRHLIEACPDSWERLNNRNQQGKDSFCVSAETEDKEVYFTGHVMETLTAEVMHSAILDSACASTVCGKSWMDSYIMSLSENDRNKVKVKDSNKIFKFGGETKIKSDGVVEIPATMAGRDVTIKTDVVDSEIPLLLSKSAMKDAKVHMNLEDDTAEVFGKKVSLDFTSSGHYCLPLNREEIQVCEVNLEDITEKEREKIISKLHFQFGHAHSSKLIELLKDAGIWKNEYLDSVKRVYENCEICKRFTKTPPKSCVGLPIAKTFNQVVSMDLKVWNEAYILHLIDCWSRYSVSVFVKNKKPEEIVDQIMKRWISIFGIMGAILSDNGGEFSNEELTEVASILNVKLLTTAAYSPHQNGLNERIHGVIDLILLKLKTQYPNIHVDVLLGWANMAKNCLHNHHGFSSHQLVFGTNPNLPNILTASPPSLEGKTMSKIFASHLNTLHSAREAFIQSEADERLRRALRHKISMIEQNFENGESVYYKRDGKQMWLGPAKVVAQDGKVVFIRHGGYLIRATPNRVIKCTAQREDTCFEEISPKEESRQNTEIEEKQLNNTVDQEKCVDNIIQTGDIEENNDQFAERQDPKVVETPRRSLRILNKEQGWNVHDVFIVQIPRHEQDNIECMKAKEVELEKLRHFDAYKEVEYTDQECISTRWVLWRKGDEIRARLVAKGFQEHEDLRTDSPTVGKAITRLALAIAVSNHWNIETTDIKSAFLQSDNIQRDVYIIPPKEVQTSGRMIWKLNKCLYGLGDAARQFHMSLKYELKRLGCQQTLLDKTVFFKKNDQGELCGLILTHVDDLLHCGNIDFEKTVMDPLCQRFKVGKRERKKFKYVGLKIEQSDHSIKLDQEQYAASLSYHERKTSGSAEILSGKDQTEFRAIAGALQWLSNGTRPDIAFDTLLLSCKMREATIHDLISSLKTIKRIKLQDIKMEFPDLGKSNKLVLYSDASFANLPDKVSSCMGYVILLVEDVKYSKAEYKCCFISWKSNKIRRICRSTLAAETMAITEGIEEAIYFKSFMSEMGISLSIEAFTDNLSLREAMYSTKQVDDKQTRIDIAALQQMLQENKVKQINWCPTEKNLANSLTKKGASTKSILEALTSGRLLM